jgi:Domain of unknown function (DUF4437)
MNNLRAFGVALAVSAFVAVCVAQGPPHVTVTPENVKWGPASPKLPPGAQVALLMGNPSQVGLPYVFRAKLPDGYSVPPHWHPMDENVTVISGIFMLGFGERFDKSATRALEAGSYAMLPKAVPHFNVMKGETILQFHGIGPYEIQYVNPADDPTRRSTTK